MGDDSRWLEPTRSLRLNWGRYDDRYGWGLILIIAGAVHVQGSNTYTLVFLLVGTAAHVTGWAILPARGWRRSLVVLPATAQILLLLTGPQSMWTFVVPLACWLLVRHRPPRSYLVLLLPIAGGVMLPSIFEEYSGMPQALAIAMALVVASAWLARVIAVSARRPSALAARHR